MCCVGRLGTAAAAQNLCTWVCFYLSGGEVEFPVHTWILDIIVQGGGGILGSSRHWVIGGWESRGSAAHGVPTSQLWSEFTVLTPLVRIHISYAFDQNSHFLLLLSELIVLTPLVRINSSYSFGQNSLFLHLWSEFTVLTPFVRIRSSYSFGQISQFLFLWSESSSFFSSACRELVQSELVRRWEREDLI